MADVRVTVSGDASGATSALQDTANATGAATEKFRLLSEGAQKAASMALQFAKDSVKAYMESERVTRQLQRATGELSAAFEQQAQILSRKNAVDDDVIKRQQTLLAQWGAAPKDIGAATQAILDYAAATGKDAVGATQELINSVEMGGGALKRIGVQFDATGRRTEDLRRAVDALGKKFGGAGEANADTLEGRAQQAGQALDDLKKQFGEFLSELDSKLHILENTARLLNAIGRGFSALTKTGVAGLLTPGVGIAAFVGGMSQEEGTTGNRVRGAMPDWTKPIGGGDDTTAFGRAAAGPSGADLLKGAFSENEKELFGSIEVGEVGALQYQKDLIRKRYDILADDADIKDGIRKMEAEHARAALEAAQKESAKWAQMGETLGASFVNALTGELDKLAAGGEFDLAGFIAGLLPVLGSVVGSLVPGLGTALGGALGGLAGVGVRAATRHHDGGWIGVPRFHGGGWPGVGPDEVPAVLQMGERVLSRSEVARAGGPDAVERMASGDGGGARFVVHVSAVDAKGVREFFEAQGGRGFYDALRTGQGILTPVFGGG